MSNQAIIIAGNIFEGHKFYGPFPDFEAALEWADKNISGEWLAALLNSAEDAQ